MPGGHSLLELDADAPADDDEQLALRRAAGWPVVSHREVTRRIGGAGRVVADVSAWCRDAMRLFERIFASCVRPKVRYEHDAPYATPHRLRRPAAPSRDTAASDRLVTWTPNSTFDRDPVSNLTVDVKVMECPVDGCHFEMDRGEAERLVKLLTSSAGTVRVGAVRLAIVPDCAVGTGSGMPPIPESSEQVFEDVRVPEYPAGFPSRVPGAVDAVLGDERRGSSELKALTRALVRSRRRPQRNVSPDDRL